MPSALAFIGGGLLEGFGKGLAEQAKETGKAKRERALKAIEQKNRLELEDVKQEGRRGLLGTQIGAQEDAAELLSEQRIDASEVAAGVATTTATELSERKVTAADLKHERDVDAAKVKAKAAKPTDTSAADSRIFDDLKDIHIEKDENQIETINWAAVSAAIAAMPNASPGLKALGKEAGKKGKGITDQGIRKRAEKSAKKTVDEIDTMFSFSEFDKYGGTKEQAFQFFVRKFIADETGGTPPTLPGPSQTPPTTKPAAAIDDPYVGKVQPADQPDAKLAKDGFWYVERDGRLYLVLKTEENRAGGGGSRRRPR